MKYCVLKIVTPDEGKQSVILACANFDNPCRVVKEFLRKTTVMIEKEIEEYTEWRMLK